jgi:hypothetical protein
MLIKGEALIQTFTFGFSISGQRNEWRVTITQPGGITTEDETVEANWHALFSEMLRAAYESANRRRFPERTGALAGNGAKR